MGYLEQHSHSNRGGMMIAAATLNGLVIYGLLAAFSGVPFRETFDPHMQAWSEKETRVPLVRPLPKPHQVTGKVQDSEPKPQEVEIGLGPVTFLDPGPLLFPTDSMPNPLGKTETPTFAPKAAAPLGNPGDWIGEADYPAAELRAGHAGTTRFRLTIGADGRVSGCEVSASSGWAGLDEATCRLVSARARFRPATDATRAATAGRFSSAIRWVIPD